MVLHRGVRFAFATMTAIGYGDIALSNAIGHVPAAPFAVFGIGMSGLFTAAVASHLTRERNPGGSGGCGCARRGAGRRRPGRVRGAVARSAAPGRAPR